ncbi:hypothetical protein H2203_007882 [Taxawa tesnikishii (nom. ined.)]|nr:hypothetical protein H2203_007882 [Dothideales sp. JES 119]
MSENIPESIPTSADRRSHRPTKKRALTPSTLQSSSKFSPKRFSAVPEIVANVQGSSAGAGSGEFHVYKASRRREYERLRAMEEEKTKEEADEKYEAGVEERKKKDAEKTDKNRAKREKAKARAMKKKGAKGGEGMDVDGAIDAEGKVKLKANVTNDANGAANGKVEGGKDGEGAGAAENPDEIGIVIHDED